MEQLDLFEELAKQLQFEIFEEYDAYRYIADIKKIYNMIITHSITKNT
jgi:hypothetical protein